MTWLRQLVRAILVLAPREIAVAVLKIIALIIALLLILLLWLWEFLLAAIRGQWLFSEETEGKCGRLPEAIIRRPDPCIYSQRLLTSQGLPVTWNNPDVWVAPAANPGAVEPDSYHLEEDTDYIVTVRAHNASTDAAIGVRVRLVYRPWSFNSPDVVPVEVDAGGNEVFQFVNISPLGSALATFRWHTPSVAPGDDKRHFCLQASVYHPLDVNTANNMGQENTNVWATPNPGPPAPGETVDVEIPLHNFSRRNRRFTFVTTRYAVDPVDTVELRMKTTLGHAKRSAVATVANVSPTYHPGRQVALAHAETGPPAGDDVGAGREIRLRETRRFTWTAQPDVVGVKNRYVGFDPLRNRLRDQDVALPVGMTVAVDGQPPDAGLPVNPGTTHTATIAIQVPNDAVPGSTHPINVVAVTEDGVLAGGVTVIINVREA